MATKPGRRRQQSVWGSSSVCVRAARRERTEGRYCCNNKHACPLFPAPLFRPLEVTTRSDGRAVFLLSFDQLPADQPLVATVTPPEGTRIVTETIPPSSPRWEITLPAVQAQLPKNLDLAIVLDTTGSMGDELNYLKAELRGIVQTVQKKFPEVQQRFALVLYRDEGDDYVTRRFDFTDALADFQKNLSSQSAGGGGDYPEAMHEGLEQANQLRWREQDTAAATTRPASSSCVPAPS
jgi:hypothetical protein